MKSATENAPHLDTPWPGARTWYFKSLKNRVDGPWRAEFTEKILWIDPATGLHCLIVRSLGDAWHAYVAVSTDHPMHGLQDEDEANSIHGGIIYAGACSKETIKDISACHDEDDFSSFWLFGAAFQNVGLQISFGGDISPFVSRTPNIGRDLLDAKTEAEILAKILHKGKERVTDKTSRHPAAVPGA